MLILISVMAFVLAAASTWTVGRYSAKLGLVDEPNARSLHQRVTPRSGGIGVLTGAAAGLLVYWFGADVEVVAAAFWLTGAALGVALISLVDDLRSISPLQRLVVHLAASAAPVMTGLTVSSLQLPGAGLDWPWLVGAGFTILFVGWFINLYNFMDGMDGFAGGMTLFGFGTYAVLGVLHGDQGFAAASLAISMGALGFLVFNFPPARIFLGDVGSASLGFLAAVFALWADRSEIAPLWVSIMLFGPFVLDATVTLIRRMANGEKVWEAHRSHYYQRLVQCGWSHRRTVLMEYGLMMLAAASALAVDHLTPAQQWCLIAVWLGTYGLLAAWVHRFQHEAEASRQTHST